MTIKAILFDLDNTLIDFMKMKKEATKAAAYAMVRAGLKTDGEELAKKLFEYYLTHDIESDDAFMNYLMTEYRTLDYRVLAAGINAYLIEKANHLKPYPGVEETLKELKKRGMKLGVVSDGVRLKAWMRLNAAGIDKFFDVVVTHEDTGKKKPSPEPFKKALEHLNVKPQEAVMVGDWPERDIDGAKNLGIKTCWAKYGAQSQIGAGDYVIDNVGDLMNVLQELI